MIKIKKENEDVSNEGWSCTGASPFLIHNLSSKVNKGYSE